MQRGTAFGLFHVPLCRQPLPRRSLPSSVGTSGECLGAIRFALDLHLGPRMLFNPFSERVIGTEMGLALALSVKIGAGQSRPRRHH